MRLKEKNTNKKRSAFNIYSNQPRQIPNLKQTLRKASLHCTKSFLQTAAMSSQTHQSGPPFVSAKETVPLVYQILLTIVEPLFAVGGAFLCYQKPANYLATMTRESIHFSEDTRFLYTELSGGFIYFAFIEAVLLRAFDDRRLWRMACLGMLLSDMAYIHSTAQAVGGWQNFIILSNWTSNDWLVFLTTIPFVIVRVLMVRGIGLKPPKGALVKKNN